MSTQFLQGALVHFGLGVVLGVVASVVWLTRWTTKRLRAAESRAARFFVLAGHFAVVLIAIAIVIVVARAAHTYQPQSNADIALFVGSAIATWICIWLIFFRNRKESD